MTHCLPPGMAWRAVRLTTLATAMALSGCSTTGPMAWEKDVLARPDMALPAGSLQDRMAEHVWSSRENSSAAGALGGGGCGCN
ncbi:MAG: hypothetical protein RL014_2744 [Pseudomonadota bacterium]